MFLKISGGYRQCYSLCLAALYQHESLKIP